MQLLAVLFFLRFEGFISLGRERCIFSWNLCQEEKLPQIFDNLHAIETNSSGKFYKLEANVNVLGNFEVW